MLLITAGRTAPNRSVVFGGEHGDLDARGRRDVQRLTDDLDLQSRCGDLQDRCGPREIAVRIGPEASVRQSAALLGLGGEEAADPAVDFGLATLDLGNWHGVAPEQLAAEQLGPWFADPVATPHGGESVADFVARIRAHVAGLPDEAVLVVATPVAQALLCPGPEAFFATDIAPAAHYRL